MTQYELKKTIIRYVSPFEDQAKCWYVVIPSKCTEQIIKAFKSIYGKKYICDCTTKTRNYIDDEGNEQQLSILKTLQKSPNARFIIVNYEGQLGSNEFLRKCTGIIAISQLNLPKNINRMYSEYYSVENYNDLYNSHLIYQESGRAKNRLQKSVNFKEGHKIPFVALLGMNSNNFQVFNRLNTKTRIFCNKNTEELNMKKLLL